MLDMNGVEIEAGDAVVDARGYTRGFAREQSGDCLIIFNGESLTRIPLSYAVVVFKNAERPAPELTQQKTQGRE